MTALLLVPRLLDQSGDNVRVIHSLAELLQSLIERETLVLKGYSRINHPTIIGNMYEGFTKDLLDRTIFDGLDLRVVDGKITNDTGELSGQVDCMIVIGEGEPIPYTSSYIYPLDRVVAVVEVKKNLHSAEIKDAHENLLTIGDSVGRARYATVRSAFWHVTGEDIPEDNLNNLADPRRMLYECLSRDLRTPLRIVLGYFGFKKEVSLQESVVEYLKKKLRHEGIRPCQLTKPDHLRRTCNC